MRRNKGKARSFESVMCEAQHIRVAVAERGAMDYLQAYGMISKLNQTPVLGMTRLQWEIVKRLDEKQRQLRDELRIVYTSNPYDTKAVIDAAHRSYELTGRSAAISLFGRPGVGKQKEQAR